jgi:cell division FtsZ-interacting protein ZapD
MKQRGNSDVIQFELPLFYLNTFHRKAQRREEIVNFLSAFAPLRLPVKFEFLYVERI